MQGSLPHVGHRTITTVITSFIPLYYAIISIVNRELIIAGSFNGRTEDFGSSNLGPIPSPAAVRLVIRQAHDSLIAIAFLKKE